MTLSDQNVRTMQPQSESGVPVRGYSSISPNLVNRAMDAARREGEEAGTIKAERNASDCIARLESRLVAAIYAIPKDTRVGHLQKEAERFEAERASMKVQLAAAEMELEHAIDRAKRAEAEAERFEALQDALDAWAGANGSRVFITSQGHMTFPRRRPIRFTKPTLSDLLALSDDPEADSDSARHKALMALIGAANLGSVPPLVAIEVEAEGIAGTAQSTTASLARLVSRLARAVGQK